MSCYAAGYRGLGTVMHMPSPPPMDPGPPPVDAAGNPVTDGIAYMFWLNEKNRWDAYVAQQRVAAERGVTPTTQLAVAARVDPAEIAQSVTLTPSVLTVEPELPGQRVGQRFSLQSIPWWGWVAVGVVAWQMFGGRR